MKRLTTISIVIGMGALLLGFQNCANQTGFSSTGELVSKTADDTTGSTDPGTGAVTDPNPGTSPPSIGGGHGNHSHPGTKGPCQNSSHTAATTTALRFVCVLRGNGKSDRIGLTGATLAGQVGTPRDVCMSENACLKILASKFDIQSAEPRGFCSNLSAHVVSMTDLEIQSALAQAELKQAMATSH